MRNFVLKTVAVISLAGFMISPVSASTGKSTYNCTTIISSADTVYSTPIWFSALRNSTIKKVGWNLAIWNSYSKKVKKKIKKHLRFRMCDESKSECTNWMQGLSNSGTAFKGESIGLDKVKFYFQEKYVGSEIYTGGAGVLSTGGLQFTSSVTDSRACYLTYTH